MPTRNVVLTDHQAYFVEQLVTSGRYQNASEVLREGLRLVERRESEDELRLTALREAADALSDGQATAKQSQERLAAWQLLQKASKFDSQTSKVLTSITLFFIAAYSTGGQSFPVFAGNRRILP